MERRKIKSLLTSTSNPENRRFNYNNCLNEYRFWEYPAADSAFLILPGSVKKGVKQEDLEILYPVRLAMTLSVTVTFICARCYTNCNNSKPGWSKPSRQKMGKEKEAERGANLPKITQQVHGKADTGTNLGKSCSSAWSHCLGNGLPRPA